MGECERPSQSSSAFSFLKEMEKVLSCFSCFCFLFLSFFGVSAGQNPAMPMGYTSTDLSYVAGYGQESLSSVLVIGSITCGSNSYVSGAKLAVSCKDAGIRRKFAWISGTTDEYGDFIVDLPSRLHDIPRLEAYCVVKILHLPKESPCQLKHLRKSTKIKLSSVGNSIRVYTTGAIKLENPNV